MPEPVKIKKNISKSQYTRGLQCLKSLWLYNYRRDLIDEITPSKQAIFDQGHEVGDLARRYFPGGVLLDEDRDHIAESITRTARLIKEGAKVLYEATFEAEGVLVRCDIIRKVGSAWHLIEVKSSTQLKEQHLPDIAIQKYVMEAAGYKISKSFLMVINTDFVKNGPIDPKEFFTLLDVTEEIAEAGGEVPANLTSFFKTLSDPDKEPAIKFGCHCSSPYACDFIGHCWKGVPGYSVFNLPYLKPEVKEDLRDRGILDITTLPPDIRLSSAAADIVKIAKTGKPIINKAAVKDFLDGLKYPLYHLDFETINPAIPLFDGYRPYQQVPFQASLHIERKPGAAPEHYEYLAEPGSDPRRPMIDFLLKHIGPDGTPLAYNKSFETSRIRELADFSPKHAKKLEELADRFMDLMAPFRSRHVFLPAFQGSYSMKAVLPALVPDMTYEGMAVANGDDAQNAYKALISGKLTPAEAEQTKKDLLAYCGQDTLAMAEVLSHLSILVVE
jgi:CRISPR/Cas system-associated exonuclease Cas4 (RecB family)